jgi:hypothetical protein
MIQAKRIDRITSIQELSGWTLIISSLHASLEVLSQITEALGEENISQINKDGAYGTPGRFLILRANPPGS